MPTVIVNGEARELDRPGVVEVLEVLGLKADRPGIAVALNGTVLPRAQWRHAALRDGDQVEVLTAVQGG